MEQRPVFLDNLIRAAYGALFLVFALFTLFPSREFFFKAIFRTPTAVLGAVVWCALIAAAWYAARRFPGFGQVLRRGSNRFAFCCAAVLLALQALFIHSVGPAYGWDPGMLMYCATNPSGFQDNLQYHFNYPNNFFLFQVYRFAAQLFGEFGAWKVLSFFSCAAVDVGVVFASWSARMLFGVKAQYLSLAALIALMAASPWVFVPYSDTLGFACTAALLWLALVLARAKRPAQQAASGAALCVLLVLAPAVKPTIVIAYIAVAIALLIYERAFLRRHLRQVLALAACAALLFGGYHVWEQRGKDAIAPAAEWEENAFGLAHFFLLGTNERTEQDLAGRVTSLYGTWNQPDLDFSRSFAVKSERDAADWQRALERLRGYGPAAAAQHYAKKLVWSFSDGTFSYGMEGRFLQTDPDGLSGISRVLCEFVAAGSPFFQNIASAWYQGVWLTVCLTSALTMWPGLHRRSAAELALFLSGGGLMLFLMLFECRARYVIIFLPVYVLISAGMFARTTDFFKERKTRYDKS